MAATAKAASGVSRRQRHSGIRGLAISLASFYRRASARSADKAVQALFISMAEAEERQAAGMTLTEAIAGADDAGIKHMLRGLEKYESLLLRKIGPDTGEIEALRIAMDMEREGIRLYSEILSEVRRPSDRNMITGLIREEQERYSMIENTCLYLTDPAWYLWNEQSFTDGGTAWA